MCVITNDNLDMVEDLVMLANRLGVHIGFQLYHSKKIDKCDFDVDDVDALVKNLIDLKDRYWNLLSTRKYISGMLNYRSGRENRCFAGRKFFSIDPYGYIHPCVDQPEAGHIIRDDISCVSTPAAMSLVSECDGCWYCFRGESEVSFSIPGAFTKFKQHLKTIYKNSVS